MWVNDAAISRAAFSHDGRLIAIATTNGKVSVRDSQSWVNAYSLTHVHPVSSLAFDELSDLLITGESGDKVEGNSDSKVGPKLHFWNAANGKPIQSVDFEVEIVAVGAASAIMAVAVGSALSPNVIVFDLKTHQERFRSKAASLPTQLALSSDGKLVAAATGFGGPGVNVWNTDDGTSRFALSSKALVVSDVTFSARGDVLAVTADSMIELHDTNLGKTITTLQVEEEYRSRGIQLRACSLAFSPNGKQLIIACNGFDMRNSDFLYTVLCSYDLESAQLQTRPFKDFRVNTVTFSPSVVSGGAIVAFGGGDCDRNKNFSDGRLSLWLLQANGQLLPVKR